MIHYDKSEDGPTLAVFSNSETVADASLLKDSVLNPLHDALADVSGGDVFIVIRNVPERQGDAEYSLCDAAAFPAIRQMLDRSHSKYISTPQG